MQLVGPGAAPTVIWSDAGSDSGMVVLSRAGQVVAEYPVTKGGAIFTLSLEGLLPASEYRYEVVSGNRVSSKHAFRTLPERNPDGTSTPFTFVAYGDNRSKPRRHAAVISSILRGPIPSLVVSTGDLVYCGSDRQAWNREFLDPAEALFAKAPIVLSLGNHDLDLDAPKPRPLAPFWLDNFAFPGHPDQPGYGRWFSFEAGGIHFIILDSTDAKNEDQLQWLKRDLASEQCRAADFRIGVFHHPPYAAGGHDSRKSLRSLWGPLLVEHQVDLVFNGHNHYYQRTWPVADGVIRPADRQEDGNDVFLTGEAPVYVITGGGGAPLYEPKQADFVAVSKKNYHHVLVQYRPGSLHCQAVAIDGLILDEFTLLNRE